MTRLRAFVELLRPRAEQDLAEHGPRLLYALEELSSARLRGGDLWGSRAPAKEAKALRADAFLTTDEALRTKRGYFDIVLNTASGQVDAGLLKAMLQEPYFALPAPKSSGRDLFNPAWLAGKLSSFADIYGRDAPVIASFEAPRALKTGQRTSNEAIIKLDNPL